MPTPDPSSGNAALATAQDEIAELFANIAAFWGFTRTQGRVYGLVFLSPGPLSHGDIQKRLGVSAGSASMTLSSLVQWGVLRRSGRLYAAQTDMWSVITGVFRRREREQVNNAIERITRIKTLLNAVDRPDPATRFALARVRQLADFFVLGRRFLDAFVARGPLHDLLGAIATRAAKFRPAPGAPLGAKGHDTPVGH